MECPHIQERLSEYIDGRLPPQEKAAVDEHLRSCMECTAALDDLKKTVGYMKDLGTVEPPAWLTQKVMGKIRAEARPKEGLFRKLFYPLHVKLPIEAVATVLVIGLALSIYRDIVPEVKRAQAPIEKSAPQVSPEEQRPMPPPSPLRLDKEKGEEPSAKGGGGGFVGKREPAPRKPAEQPSFSEGTSLKTDKLGQSELQEAAKRKEGEEAPGPVKELQQAPVTGAIAKDEAPRAAGATAPEAKLSYVEKKKEETRVLTVFVKDPGAAVKEIEKILKELEGKMIRTESVEGKEIITAEVNAARLKELIARLKVTGRTKEGEIDLAAMKGEIGVRVEIVKTSGGE